MKINLLPENLNWKKKLLDGFNTERLIFRSFSDDDLAPVLLISNDNELFTYVTNIKHCGDLTKWLESVYQRRNYLFFTIRGSETCEHKGTLLGVLMLNSKKPGSIEVGGWVGKKYQKKGFGSETLAGLINYVKQKSPDMHLYAETREDNFAAFSLLDVDGIERKVNRCHYDNDSDSSV